MQSEQECIKIAYEREGMSVGQIAKDRELDVVAVKATLMHVSSKYRQNALQEGEKEDELNFSNQDLVMANDVIRETARYAESEDLRLKAAIYIRDDKKGRKEIVNALKGMQFNIFQINEQLREARAQREIRNTIELQPA